MEIRQQTKCINAECNNDLTDYEIKRMNPKQFSKKRLCRKCRAYNPKALRINCVGCSSVFTLQGKSMYCVDCFKEMTRIRVKKHNYKTYWNKKGKET